MLVLDFGWAHFGWICVIGAGLPRLDLTRFSDSRTQSANLLTRSCNAKFRMTLSLYCESGIEPYPLLPRQQTPQTSQSNANHETSTLPHVDEDLGGVDCVIAARVTFFVEYC